jgi:hypothetical protein
MLKGLLRRQLDRFARRWDYDASYMREVLEADLGAFLRFAPIQGMTGYCRGVPRACWYTAKIVTVLDEDCGPCTQLVLRMAEADGVMPELLRAILDGDVAAMPADVALAWRFADAVRRRSPDAEELRQAVVASWGMRGLISLAYGITTARMYPTLKAALGHAQTCQRVTVGGASRPVQRRAA